MRLPIITALLLFPLPLPAAPLELDELRQQYAKAVTAPFEEGKKALDAKYGAALDSAAKAAQQKGSLDEVVALTGEQKRVADGLPIPSTEEDAPEALKKLRAIYHQQSDALNADLESAKAKLLPAYTAKLQELETALTKAGRIPDALLVKAHREGLGTESVPMAPAVVTNPDPARSAPSSPRAKGDDRKAAEWIVGLVVEGSTTNVTVQSGNQSFKCTKLSDLPKGEFFVTHFLLDGFKAPFPRQIANEETAILSGLERLVRFQINKIGITDDGLKFVASCPEIAVMELHGLELTDECFRHFAGLKKLKVIDFDAGCRAMTGSGLAQMQGSPVETLEFTAGGFDDAGLTHLESFKDLSSLGLAATRVTDSGIATLQGLSKLTSLNLANTNVTPEALVKLRGLKLSNLAFGRSDNWSSLTPRLPALAAAFPDVIETTLPRGGTYAISDLEPLVAAFPKLRVLRSTDAKFAPGAFEVLARFSGLEDLHISSAFVGDAELAALPRLKSLVVLELGTTPVTDAGLASLAGVKRLKTLAFKKTTVTPAALADFQKIRPDVILK